MALAATEEAAALYAKAENAKALAGTGIVPELDFALAEGDVITITIAAVGTLTNTVAVGREPFAFLATENLEDKR